MARVHGSAWSLGLLLTVLFGVCERGIARAQARPADAAPAQRLPRTLHGGAPARRLPATTRAKPNEPSVHVTPAPSISLDPRERAPQVVAQLRSRALLEREIRLLERLVASMRRDLNHDSRHADVLLRLAYAYQELMWIQKQELNELQKAQPQDCGCNSDRPDEAGTAVALAPLIRR